MDLVFMCFNFKTLENIRYRLKIISTHGCNFRNVIHLFEFTETLCTAQVIHGSLLTGVHGV